MFTSGFFNSINSDRRYNAEQMAAIFDGLITDGIFDSIGDHFQVTPASSGLGVNIGTGRAWLNQTWSYNDTAYPVTLDAASPSLSRKDLICIKVDKSSAVRSNSLVVIAGTPAASPVEPTVTDDTTNEIYYHKLAAVTVQAGATSISAADITNYIGLSTGTPYVTGLLSSTSVDELWSQWDGEFNDWWDDIKATLDDNIVTTILNKIDHITPKESTMNLYGFSHINPPPEGKTYQEYSTDAILNQISSLLNKIPTGSASICIADDAAENTSTDTMYNSQSGIHAVYPFGYNGQKNMLQIDNSGNIVRYQWNDDQQTWVSAGTITANLSGTAQDFDHRPVYDVFPNIKFRYNTNYALPDKIKLFAMRTYLNSYITHLCVYNVELGTLYSIESDVGKRVTMCFTDEFIVRISSFGSGDSTRCTVYVNSFDNLSSTVSTQNMFSYAGGIASTDVYDVVAYDDSVYICLKQDRGSGSSGDIRSGIAKIVINKSTKNVSENWILKDEHSKTATTNYRIYNGFHMAYDNKLYYTYSNKTSSIKVFEIYSMLTNSVVASSTIGSVRTVNSVFSEGAANTTGVIIEDYNNTIYVVTGRRLFAIPKSELGTPSALLVPTTPYLKLRSSILRDTKFMSYRNGNLSPKVQQDIIVDIKNSTAVKVIPVLSLSPKQSAGTWAAYREVLFSIDGTLDGLFDALVVKYIYRLSDCSYATVTDGKPNISSVPGTAIAYV